MARGLSGAELNKLARIGAAARLGELEREIEALRRAFPGLSRPAASTPAASVEPASALKTKLAARVPRRGRRKPMSPAERKAVSERMKRYWDGRRKTNGK